MPDNPFETPFKPERLDRLKELLQDLKERAQAAHQAGDTYMFSIYNSLVKVTSPIVVNATARLERESKAALNKAENAMRLKERQAKQVGA